MTDAERIQRAIEALEVVEKYRPLSPEDAAIGRALGILRKQDTGGLLPPGDTKAVNDTGKPESVS